MRCLIVDDDKTSRLIIERFVQRTAYLDLVGQCENALDAYGILKEEPIDLLLLDIQMPKMTGLDLLEILREKFPQVIFITTSKTHAIQAFDYGLTDYLVKPITYERFLKAIEKAKQNLGRTILDSKTPDDIYIKTNNKIVRLYYNLISHIEACADYVIIYEMRKKKKYMVYSTMKSMEQKLPANFIRIHRSFIINMEKITSIDDKKVILDEHTLPVGASYKKQFLQKLHYLN